MATLPPDFRGESPRAGTLMALGALGALGALVALVALGGLVALRAP